MLAHDSAFFLFCEFESSASLGGALSARLCFRGGTRSGSKYGDELVWRYCFAPGGDRGCELGGRHCQGGEGQDDLSFAGAGSRIEPFDLAVRCGGERHADPDEDEQGAEP